jgi:uncharacterized protein (TIGR02646 family)
MKFIPKNIKNEPPALRAHRKTEGSTYQSIKGLKEALLQEQGFLCAYCLRLIRPEQDKSGVEHILPRATYPDKQLDYSNLVAVCSGDYGENAHCDKTEEYILNSRTYKGKMDGTITLTKLYPTNKEIERLIEYDTNGSIKPILQDSVVEEDLLKLNLNDEKYKSYRKIVMDAVLRALIKLKPNKVWTKKDFESQIMLWETQKDGKYKAFFPIAVWYLKNLASKPQYRT